MRLMPLETPTHAFVELFSTPHDRQCWHQGGHDRQGDTLKIHKKLAHTTGFIAE
jgi:hypothetical protein